MIEGTPDVQRRKTDCGNPFCTKPLAANGFSPEMEMLTVIIAATRTSVARAASSIPIGMPGLAVERLVVFDGMPFDTAMYTYVRERIADLKCGTRELAQPHLDWGSYARTVGMSAAKGGWLMFLDDDDIWLPGALEAVGCEIAAQRGLPARLPCIFRMERRARGMGILWKTRDVRMGNVSTQMILAPNEPEKLGRWTGRYQADYDFIAGTVARHGSVRWNDAVIARWNAD